MKNRAIFLDRDGTLNKDVGYPSDFSQIHVYPFSIEAIRDIHRLGFLAVVVTNQSGIGRGLIPKEALDDIHERLSGTFKRRMAPLDKIYYCPHHVRAAVPKYRRDCSCRKPKPGMGRKAAAELGLDLRKSYMIGDKVEDVRFGQAIGATSILVLTGFGRRSLAELRKSTRPPAHVARNLQTAVRWIARREHRAGRPRA